MGSMPRSASVPEQASYFAADHLLQHLFVERQIGDHFAQPRIPFLELPRLLHFRRHQPAVKSASGDRTSPRQYPSRGRPHDARTAFRLLKRNGNLLLGQLRFSSSAKPAFKSSSLAGFSHSERHDFGRGAKNAHCRVKCSGLKETKSVVEAYRRY